MTDNILKKSLDVTNEDFLKRIYEAKSKPMWRALTMLFGEIVTGRSTLVSDLSLPLQENSTMSERKRAQERVSGWLENYNFVEEAGGWLLKNIPEMGLDGLTFAVDFSDISKVFGGDGMEGMSMGRDGSTGDIRMGHDFICLSRLGSDEPYADGHLRRARGAGVLRQVADRDIVLCDEAGIRAGEGSCAHVQASQQHLHPVCPCVRLCDTIPSKGEGFRKILKYLSDNLETVSTKTHALLVGIRALVKEARIRFISGRPRKRTVDDRQMALPGF